MSAFMYINKTMLMLPLSGLILATLVSTVSADSTVRTFLDRHWQFPIPPQGPPPTAFTAPEASLDPASCGGCHPFQYADWRTSVHAKSMGPGIMGQLLDMMRSDVLSALDCQRCHSPLAEQQQKLRVYDPQGTSKLINNRAFEQTLQAKGLVCAACHVRAWERFGPPKRDGSLVSNTPRETLPHRGATRTAAFLKSEFCMGCHQFPENGFALNGKLLENTYEEWRASIYARDGVQCQDCHMPDRRHLWRGIHDSDMVKRGVTIDLQTGRNDTEVQATLSVINSGVGHYFPTYLTPKVFLRIELMDAAGRPIKDSVRQAVIGREVPLDLSREVYDTRLPPQQSFRMHESWSGVPPGLRLRAEVVVEPDHFYTRFFQATIPYSEHGRRQLEEALRQTQQSSFTIFVREVLL
jgi:hypothetical protein